MRYQDVAIPQGHARSSPFVKWQGSLAEVHSIDLAAAVTGRALADRSIDPAGLDGLALGCSHPQGPTGLRSITELIETLRTRGGGIGLFTGCAAGDTGAALVLEVADQ